MTALVSGLYAGEVVHQRFSPRRHHLKYRLFQLLFDLDEGTRLSDRSRLFSVNRFNAVSFHEADHGDGAAGGLRAYVDRLLAGAGLSAAGGQVALLCMPRIFGRVFNPLSIYYCRDAAGALVAVIYEVNNTFGERHTYLIPADGTAGGVIRQRCAKAFYVSPFMDMDMNYDFALTAPGETIATTIRGLGPDGEPLIYAAFTGRRRELSDGALLRMLAGYPLVGLGVVIAIHWEALKLFAKGLRLRRRSPAPGPGLSIVAAAPPPASAGG